MGILKKSKSGLKRILLGVDEAQRFGERKGRFRIPRDGGIVPNPVGSMRQNPGDAGAWLGFPVTSAVSQAGL